MKTNEKKKKKKKKKKKRYMERGDKVLNSEAKSSILFEKKCWFGFFDIVAY